jgi:hypothetical protein
VLHPDGQELNRFPGGNTQDDPRPLDLEPGERPTTSDAAQDRSITGSDLQGTRFSTTHGTTPVAGTGYRAQRTDGRQFLALLCASDTRSHTALDADRRREPLRRHLERSLGVNRLPWPPALQSKVVGTLHRPGYRIEKVIYGIRLPGL